MYCLYCKRCGSLTSLPNNKTWVTCPCAAPASAARLVNDTTVVYEGENAVILALPDVLIAVERQNDKYGCIMFSGFVMPKQWLGLIRKVENYATSK